MKKVGVSLILLILLFSFGQLTYGAADPAIQQGRLSVQNWNFNQQGSIDLSGEWRKYEKKLLSPQKVKEEEADSFSEPGLWQEYSIFGRKLSFLKEMKSGYATYHLTLEDIDQTQANTLKIGEIANSYKVWVNGDLVAENGRVGRKIDLESPKIKERIIELPKVNNVDIVIQLSNFHFKQKRVSSYLENIKLGTKEQLQTDNLMHVILLTSLFLVFIIFFFAYLFRGRDKQLYYFALFNVLLVLKIGLFSDWLDLGLIGKITYWYQTKIDILFSIAILVVFVKYLKTLYPKLISDVIFKVILSLGVVTSLTVIVSSVQLYNGMFVYGQIILAFLIVYLLYTVLTGLVRGKMNYFVTGILFISLVVVYDSNIVLNELLLVNVYSGILILLNLYESVYLIKNSFRSIKEYDYEKDKRVNAENLLETISFLHSSLDNEQIARLAARKLPKLIQYDAIAIMGKEGDCLKELVIRGERNIEDDKIKIDSNELFNDVTNRTTPMIVQDVEDFPWFSKYGKLTNVKSWIGVPLIFEEEIIGVLTLGNKKIIQYNESEKERLTQFSDELAIALKNSYDYAEIEELAAKDSLTGLYNRESFKELAIKEYHQAVRYEHDLSFILIDIDQYQDIINEFDYGVADEIVRILAQRCQESIRTADYMGRYQGVKLGIVLTDTDLFGAKELARRLQEIINKPIDIENQGDILVSASFGIAALEEKVGLETLFNLADSALAKAQKEGGDCIKTSKD